MPKEIYGERMYLIEILLVSRLPRMRREYGVLEISTFIVFFSPPKKILVSQRSLD